MPKFFVDNSQISENEIIILGQDVNHIKKVLRAKLGEELEICNEQSGENFLCSISEIQNDKIKCDIKNIIDSKTESNICVTIFQGIPKADKMELIIQKAVELGVFDIIPVEMKRCVVKLDEKDKIKKVERWQKISEVAAKQCGRDMIPEICNVTNVENICNFIEKYDIVFTAYENEKEDTLKQELKKLKENVMIKLKNNEKIKIGVIVGPEGGLEQNDVEKLQKYGTKTITLGKRILRTETVALNVLSIIMYELEN